MANKSDRIGSNRFFIKISLLSSLSLGFVIGNEENEGGLGTVHPNEVGLDLQPARDRFPL